MEQTPVREPGIRNLGFKVGLVLTLIPVLIVALLLYVLHVRGVFERTQALYLLAPDAEGVNAGMPVTFSGFPVGQVAGMTLTESGEVRIEVRIKEKTSRWLRVSSVFTIDKPWFGGARIRVTSPNLQDPPLLPEAERKLVTRDATQDLPQVIARANTVLQNVEAITRPDSSFNQSLQRLQVLTERMTGEYGMMEGLTGSPERAERILATIDGVQALVRSLKGVTTRADSLLAKTDDRVFGQGGVMDEAQKSMLQLGKLLLDARESLKKADVVLADAQSASADLKSVSANVKAATADLSLLRGEVDESIRKVNALIVEINRKWPFARKTEIKLP
jgi:phospholipid/cholesterol/gamma-HCH transport system substrate-binding protein